jgi:hypothetical protein
MSGSPSFIDNAMRGVAAAEKVAEVANQIVGAVAKNNA